MKDDTSTGFLSGNAQFVANLEKALRALPLSHRFRQFFDEITKQAGQDPNNMTQVAQCAAHFFDQHCLLDNGNRHVMTLDDKAKLKTFLTQCSHAEQAVLIKGFSPYARTNRRQILWFMGLAVGGGTTSMALGDRTYAQQTLSKLVAQSPDKNQPNLSPQDVVKITKNNVYLKDLHDALETFIFREKLDTAVAVGSSITTALLAVGGLLSRTLHDKAYNQTDLLPLLNRMLLWADQCLQPESAQLPSR